MKGEPLSQAGQGTGCLDIGGVPSIATVISPSNLKRGGRGRRSNSSLIWAYEEKKGDGFPQKRDPFLRYGIDCHFSCELEKEEKKEKKGKKHTGGKFPQPLLAREGRGEKEGEAGPISNGRF